MSPTIQLRCCLCGQLVDQNDPDGYSIQIRKFGTESPEMVWAHGPCLRKVIPVIGVEIPNSQRSPREAD
jgi:hypothetical protein